MVGKLTAPWRAWRSPIMVRTRRGWRVWGWHIKCWWCPVTFVRPGAYWRRRENLSWLQTVELEGCA